MSGGGAHRFAPPPAFSPFPSSGGGGRSAALLEAESPPPPVPPPFPVHVRGRPRTAFPTPRSADAPLPSGGVRSSVPPPPRMARPPRLLRTALLLFLTAASSSAFRRRCGPVGESKGGGGFAPIWGGVQCVPWGGFKALRCPGEEREGFGLGLGFRVQGLGLGSYSPPPPTTQPSRAVGRAPGVGEGSLGCWRCGL